MSLFLRSLCLALAIGLSVPSGAGAAQRWAAPSSARVSGPCVAIDPCRLAEAISGAADGDEVVLAPGIYSVAGELTVRGRVTLRGASGPSRPVLAGAANGPSLLTLKAGGAIRHVEIRASKDALHMQGGLAEDVLLSSAGGDGVKMDDSPSATVLRDSVVRTDAGAGAALRVHTG